MKCPHCQKESRAKVMESRQCEGQVWRRRICGACFKTFVSVEVTDPNMRMPNQTQSRYRVKDPKPKPEETGVIRSTAAHLQGIWS